MARLRTVGFEVSLGPTGGANGSEIDGLNNASVEPVLDATVARSGGKSVKFALSSLNSSTTDQRFISTLGVDYFFRMYVRFDAFPANTVRIIEIQTGAFQVGAAIAITSGGVLRLTDSANAQVGSDSLPLDLNVWYRVELHTNVPAAGNGTAEARLNGVQFAGSTNVSVLNAATEVWEIGVSDNPGSTSNMWADDVALNDGTGTNQNSWPGDGKIVLLEPISDQQVGSWNAGAGGATNLWDAVNNLPPVGLSAETNTSQIKRLAQDTADSNRYYANLKTYSTAGIGAVDTITVIHGLLSHGEEVATGTKTGLLRGKVSGANLGAGNDGILLTGTFTFGDDVGALATFPSNWRTAWGSGTQVIYNPTGIALGSSPVVGVSKEDTGTAEGDVDFLGLYVEYVTGALPGFHRVATQRLPLLGKGVWDKIQGQTFVVMPKGSPTVPVTVVQVESSWMVRPPLWLAVLPPIARVFSAWPGEQALPDTGGDPGFAPFVPRMFPVLRGRVFSPLADFASPDLGGEANPELWWPRPLRGWTGRLTQSVPSDTALPDLGGEGFTMMPTRPVIAPLLRVLANWQQANADLPFGVQAETYQQFVPRMQALWRGQVIVALPAETALPDTGGEGYVAWWPRTAPTVAGRAWQSWADVPPPAAEGFTMMPAPPRLVPLLRVPADWQNTTDIPVVVIVIDSYLQFTLLPRVIGLAPAVRAVLLLSTAISDLTAVAPPAISAPVIIYLKESGRIAIRLTQNGKLYEEL